MLPVDRGGPRRPHHRAVEQVQPAKGSGPDVRVLGDAAHQPGFDQAFWATIIATFNTTGHFEDSSTGIAKQRGATLVGAWNYCLRQGLVTGRAIADPNSDQDKYNAWKNAYDSETFDITSIFIVHMWDIAGKPLGDDDSPAMRPPRLDYADEEIYDILRRYQGPGAVAYSEAKKRMGLYYVMEKYNAISRNL
ncbi:hypothetical protein [Kitasatospora aureofaciens]|uniref:hypothetical protein n=1 Tax=Kitasatospora aureofaciens TaxID=1894 RepID=UPI0037C9EA0A